jgi:hypothetical protein
MKKLPTIVLFVLVFISVYALKSMYDDVTLLFNNDNIKTEYKIEIIDQDYIKVYSNSNDTVYKGTFKEFEEIVHMDNL